MSPLLMQENGNGVADPSPASAPGQDDTPSVFFHSAKLRNKLEKLAQWRVDPSLIEFPPDSREFTGGFATVSQGLWASNPSPAEDRTNKSEHTTNEHLSSEAGRLHSDKDPQESEEDHQGKDEEADGRAIDCNNDQTNGEERKDNDQERKPQDQSSILRVEVGSGALGHIADEDQDLENRNPQPQGDTQEPNDGQKDQNEGINHLQKADDDNDQTKDEARKESNSSNEERHSHQPLKPKNVAVKKLKIESDKDLERVLGLALRESEFLTQLSHPNIVKFEGFVEDLPGHRVWLVFPWEEHGNLRDFLASGEWEIPERISLINDVTLGLEYLHSREPPIYHGDLKSLNILVNLEFHALITDFGSARHLANDRVGKRPTGAEDSNEPRPATDLSTAEEFITLEALFSATASTLTLTGSSYTLRWAAPELLQDDRPCLRSDIWSLGWIAYEVMTNTIPFHDVKKDAIVINRVIQGHLPSVTEDARMSLIRALCSMMVQCWNMDPDKRPTAEECRKLISWLVNSDALQSSMLRRDLPSGPQPMIVPAPTQGIDEKVSSTRYARLLNQLGRMYKRQGDYLNALNCFTKASNIYTVNHNNKGKARNLRSLANLQLFRGEHLEAASFYTEALQISTKTGDQTDRASTLWGLAEVRRGQREYSEAKRLYSECLQIYTGIDHKRSRATSLFGLASVHLSQSEYNEAETLYSEALEIFNDVGDKNGRGNALWSLGEVHRLRGEYSEATERYSNALEIVTETGDRQGRGSALWGLAEVHTGRGEYDDAIKLFSEAIEIFTNIGDKYWRADALMSLAESHRMQAHHNEAISFYERASKALEEIGEIGRAAAALRDAKDVRTTLEEGVAGSAETAKVEGDPLSNLG